MEKTAAPLEWIKDGDVRAVAIVGICKNAGKTTLLNHILSLRPKHHWGVFSTGLDGEAVDTLFRIPKPAVKLGPGTIFCCDTAALDKLGSSVEVLEKPPVGSVSRTLWLARSLVSLETEITGPGSVAEQVRVLRRMRSHGAATVLIDGSLDRKSIALSEAMDAVIVLIGASFGPIPAIISELRRLTLLSALPRAQTEPGEYQLLLGADQLLALQEGAWTPTGLKSLMGNAPALKNWLEKDLAALYIPGALTDVVYTALREALAASGATIIFRHPECLKLGLNRLERLVDEVRPQVLIPFGVKAWVLNSAAVGTQSVDALDFRGRIRQAFPQLELSDIRELAL